MLGGNRGLLVMGSSLGGGGLLLSLGGSELKDGLDRPGSGIGQQSSLGPEWYLPCVSWHHCHSSNGPPVMAALIAGAWHWLDGWANGFGVHEGWGTCCGSFTGPVVVSSHHGYRVHDCSHDSRLLPLWPSRFEEE